MIEVTPEQEQAVDRIARFIVRMGFTAPAILSLESMRPLSFVGSQFMHVLSPSITAFLPWNEWDDLAHLLEDRNGVDVVIRRIEAVAQEAECSSQS